MSRLDDLYKAIETMRREHLSTADLEAKVSLAEEEIIKNEILPVLKQNIEWVIGTGTEVNPQSWTQHLLFICEEDH